eukprot:9501255-Lingulodinium_polyedra.AAC.1
MSSLCPLLVAYLCLVPSSCAMIGLRLCTELCGVATTIGHMQPLGGPSGVVYRTGDLKRPDRVDHGDFVWVALRL